MKIAYIVLSSRTAEPVNGPWGQTKERDSRNAQRKTFHLGQYCEEGWLWHLGGCRANKPIWFEILFHYLAMTKNLMAIYEWFN